MKLEQIEKQVDDGDFPGAYSAIEDILSLGPSNLRALKLKAFLLASEGKFSEEASVWKNILHIDEEDVDANEYFQRSATEQREHEFFSDFLASGGIRFLANPQSVLNSSFAGVIGCALFLALLNFSRHYPFLAKPVVSYIAFSVLIVLPMIAILFIYFRSLQDITIDRESIHLRTRTSDHELKWQDVLSFYLARRSTSKENALFVLLIPKAPEQNPILIKNKLLIINMQLILYHSFNKTKTLPTKGNVFGEFKMKFKPA